MPANSLCLILAAGFGTRMGPIGKQLPKVMWPVFGLSLLELQVRFARQLGYDRIFINLHHQSQIILDMAKANAVFKDVKWLLESPEILDIGGAIHNLASQKNVNYSGELLVLNSDQFLWFSESELQEWRRNNEDMDSLLLTREVNSSQGYNALKLDPTGRFLGITQNKDLPRDQAVQTYSGNSIIQLKKLKPISGVSAFFESVCPPSSMVRTQCLERGNYWDFGTAHRYIESLFEILDTVTSSKEDEFVKFLIREGALVLSQIHHSTRSYNCMTQGLIHLGSGYPSTSHPPGVVISGMPIGSGEDPVLVYHDLVQPLD